MTLGKIQTDITWITCTINLIKLGRRQIVNRIQSEAKRYLDSIAKIDKSIEALKLEIIKLETLASGVTAIQYDRDKVQTSPKDRMPDILIKLVEVEKKLKAQYEELFSKKLQAYNIIDSLDTEMQKSILISHFFQDKTLFELTEIMHVSESTIYREYEKALEQFGLIMQGN